MTVSYRVSFLYAFRANRELALAALPAPNLPTPMPGFGEFIRGRATTLAGPTQ